MMLLCAACTFGTGLNAGAEAAPPPRFWTLGDIISVPEITDLLLARDRSTAVYIEQVSNLPQDRAEAAIWSADLPSGERRLLLRATSARELRRIPGTADWSALLDMGEGVQLYRIDQRGNVSPLIVRTETVLVGLADQAVPLLTNKGPQHVGVLFHDWSPDGNWLWYAVLRQAGDGREIRYDDAVLAERGQYRSQASATIEFHLRSRDGADHLVTSRPAADRLALYYGGAVSWDKEDVRYRIERVDQPERPSFETFVWSHASGRAQSLGIQLPVPALEQRRGPRGGQLSSSGVGEPRALVETFPDGSAHHYGRFPFAIENSRSAGSWLSQSRSEAIISVRTFDNPRYRLALVRRGGVRVIETEGSLTKCDFAADLSAGVCVRESLTAPPELVSVDPRRGSVRRLASIASEHERILPLRISPRRWINRLGYQTTGFIVWPRDFAEGRRYPAIIVTHASDADQRFAHPALQWNYPVQLFAEHGYIVLLMNDPAPQQDQRLSAAYAMWRDGEGALAPTELQRLIWLNGVYSFEDAVRELAGQGVLDPARVGIAGYSRGSQMANVTMTQSVMFGAASSGDGGFLEPSGYPDARRSYDVIFGGTPYGSSLDTYLDLSPSLRASRVCGAILQQMAGRYSGALDFHHALRAAGIPAQISLYPGEAPTSDETHIFHIPSNRMRAMQENLAWFDYWLLGRRDGDMPYPGRFDRWSAMAQAFAGQCPEVPTASENAPASR